MDEPGGSTVKKISKKQWDEVYKERSKPKEYNRRGAQVWEDRVKAGLKSAQSLTSEECNGLSVKGIRHRLQLDGKALGYSVQTTAVSDTELWFRTVKP
jgi:hypothetical protein